MPLIFSDFPEEVQVAFFLYDFLPDNWEGMSGSYLGKDYSTIEFLFKLFEVLEPKETLLFIKLYDQKVVEYRMKKQQQKEKANKAKKSPPGAAGKKYVHNVKG